MYYIASENNTLILEEFEEFLADKCSRCKKQLIKYSKPIKVWPPDTFHYCYGNTHVTVKGNDQILYRDDGDTSSKKAWSNYEIALEGRIE